MLHSLFTVLREADTFAKEQMRPPGLSLLAIQGPVIRQVFDAPFLIHGFQILEFEDPAFRKVFPQDCPQAFILLDEVLTEPFEDARKIDGPAGRIDSIANAGGHKFLHLLIQLFIDSL